MDRLRVISNVSYIFTMKNENTTYDFHGHKSANQY